MLTFSREHVLWDQVLISSRAMHLGEDHLTSVPVFNESIVATWDFHLK